MGRALVISGDETTLYELADTLRPHLPCDTAGDAEEAVTRLRIGGYDVIVLEHRPPVWDASALIDRILAQAPDALAILVTEEQLLAEDFEAKAPGRAFRFVGDHSQRWQLPGMVREGLKLVRLRREQQELVQKLGGQLAKLQKREKLLDVVVRERTKELETAYQRLKSANRQALLGLAEAIEAKDAYTKGHCGRVADFTLAVARHCNYPADELETLEYASFLHDIGKIGVRDAVLLKPGPLDPAEWAHMRTHPVVGDTIASQIEMLRPMRPAIRNHHERWDGTGYPDGMKGAVIPLAARIVCIADAFDAMITDRPYKRALPYEECLTLLSKNAGSQFDPDLVAIFTRERIGEDR